MRGRQRSRGAGSREQGKMREIKDKKTKRQGE
jgi:hypothetical protein